MTPAAGRMLVSYIYSDRVEGGPAISPYPAR